MEHVPSVKKEFLGPLVRIYVCMISSSGWLRFSSLKAPSKGWFSLATEYES